MKNASWSRPRFAVPIAPVWRWKPLTAVTVAALTLYDMLKAIDRGMAIEEVVLLEKRGGRSGHYLREP